MKNLNEMMYGVAEVDGYAKQIAERCESNPTALSGEVMDLIGIAKEQIAYDPAAAIQALNRAQLLILRCCPMVVGYLQAA